MRDKSTRGKSMLKHFFLLLTLILNVASAANLKPETVNAWSDYVKKLDGHEWRSFASEHPGAAARVRAGEIIVEPSSDPMPISVPHGLIHDWSGAAFLPGATIDEVVRILRDYDRYKEFYHPYVLESAAISVGDREDRFSGLLMNKSVFAKTALQTTYRSQLRPIDAQRF